MYHQSTQITFHSRIRHDLRTLLNAIIGYSEMLLEDAEAEKNQAWVSTFEEILEAGRDVLEAVNQELDPANNESILNQVDAKKLGEHLLIEMQAPLELIIFKSDALLKNAQGIYREDICKDLQKINTAAKTFLSRLGTFEDFTDTSIETIDAGNGPLIEEPNSIPTELQGNILVVDDNEINRDVLSRHLARQGHTVRLAEDGRQALEILENEASTLDLVLLDVVMPQMNGIHLLQHLKKNPSMQDIPVIMLSALDELDIVVQCIHFGAEDYLSKPFNSVLLKTRTAACLEKKRLRDQEVEYLKNVALITDAAAAVEGNTFMPDDLALVAKRNDALGQLARVFKRMAREVYTREQLLQHQVQRLKIELDEARQSRQVTEITESAYFQKIKEKTQELRKIIGDGE